MEENKETAREIFDIEFFGLKDEVKLCWETYSVNGTLALMLYCKPAPEDEELIRRPWMDPENPYIEPFGTVTVNLEQSGSLPDDVQFVDTNNFPDIDRWLIENRIAAPTGYVARSGYCLYPAFKFNCPREALQKVMDRKAELSGQKEKEKEKEKTGYIHKR